MKVRKAVFPSAGFGTRFLPITKTIPKEMLPIVDKPLIQYSIEEAKDSGIEQIIIVTSRGKTAIEDYFDRDPELEAFLLEKGKEELEKRVKQLSELAEYVYVRQKIAQGLGDAIMHSENVVCGEPFAVFLSDDIIDSKIPVMKQLMDVYQQFGGSVLAVERVPRSKAFMYGIIKGRKVAQGVYEVEDLVEKPEDKPPSNLAIMGRYILTPRIFDALRNTQPGRGGEVQLTDAIRNLLSTEKVYACEFEGTRYDAGDKLGFIKANIAFSLKRKEFRGELRRFLKKLL
ncbi:MAG TPA: UTP--glucose-1-phosphate uridylyltransferase GalU [Deltaproteobacteria bacterium]|nr:UTP--glucose-1-phosphate uridylyltransferase GalU [Deltaproteobacteria bacterium]